MRRHHHARLVEGFAGKIGGSAGRRGDLNAGQHLGHSDGLGGRLGDAALRIGNRDRGAAHVQGAGGGVGVPGHGPAGFVGIVRRHHHARLVEGFAILVRRLAGRRSHRDMVQDPHSHRHGGSLCDTGPFVGNSHRLGSLRHGFRGKCAILRHVCGGIVRKGRRHHHARRVEILPDEICGFVRLLCHGHAAGDHQVHLIQQGTAHLYHLGHVFTVQGCGHGPAPHVWQFKLRRSGPLQGCGPIRTGHGRARAGCHLDGRALHPDGLFQVLQGGPLVLPGRYVVERDQVLCGHAFGLRQGVCGCLVVRARGGFFHAVLVALLGGGLFPFQQSLHLDLVLFSGQGAAVGVRILVVFLNQSAQGLLQFRL